MRFSNSTLLWIPLGIAILWFLLHKTVTIAQLLPRFPHSVTEIVLHGAGFVLHVQLLRQQPWAWLLVFALNILTLILALAFWGQMEWHVRPVVLQSVLMLVLLYLNRRLYLKPMQKSDTPESGWMPDNAEF